MGSRVRKSCVVSLSINTAFRTRFPTVIFSRLSGRELVRRSLKIRKPPYEICHTFEAVLNPAGAKNIYGHDKTKVRCANPLIHDSGGARLVTTVLAGEVNPVVESDTHYFNVTAHPRYNRQHMGRRLYRPDTAGYCPGDWQAV